MNGSASLVNGSAKIDPVSDALNSSRQGVGGRKWCAEAFLHVPVPTAFHLMTSWEVELRFEKRRRESTLKTSDHVYRFLASPNSSVGARLFASCVLVLSILSIFTLGLEVQTHAAWIHQFLSSSKHANSTLPIEVQLDEWDAIPYTGVHLYLFQGWYGFRLFLLIVFVLELVLRICAYPNPWRSTMTWIDLLCIIPLVIREVAGATTSQIPLQIYLVYPKAAKALFIFTALSSLRMMKMTYFTLGSVVLRETAAASLTALVIPAYVLVMLFTFFGTAIFAVEYDPLNLDDPSALPDIVTAWWMLIVTMTTVGYGDFTPKTVIGRTLTGMAILAGAAVMAMPLAVVGRNFAEAWERRTITLIAEKIKSELHSQGHEINDAVRAFEFFDRRGDYQIAFTEFKDELCK